MQNTHQLRIETDSLGTIEIPANALYGSNTARALQNFPLKDKTLGSETALLQAMLIIKKAAALANRELHQLPPDLASAIVNACDDLLTGDWSRHFPVPLLEGSGGTSTNMNVNEVICNRALQILHHAPGQHQHVHPNDHVNLGQSTNDVVPSAIKLAALKLLPHVTTRLNTLSASLNAKASAFQDTVRLGRTCLQDAQPMTLGQAFSGYATVVQRCAGKLAGCADDLATLPLGGTAIGTGMGAAPGYKPAVFRHLCEITGIDLAPSENPFDGMQNLDNLQRLSAELEATSAVIAKISKDLILMSSGPTGGLAEITLPAVQPGSSIMPGKINPVMPMAMIQLSQVIHGNHTCISMACQDGMLEINHYEMVVASRLLDSLQRMNELLPAFDQRCIQGIEANAEHCAQQLRQSYALATALVPQLGYARVSALVKKCVSQEQPFIEACLQQGLLNEHDVDNLIRQSTRVVTTHE